MLSDTGIPLYLRTSLQQGVCACVCLTKNKLSAVHVLKGVWQLFQTKHQLLLY